VNIIINYRRRRKEKTPSLSLSLSTIPPFIFLLSPELLVPFFSILHFTLLHIFQNTKSRNTEQTPIASIVVLNFRLFRSFLYSISSSLKFSQRIMSSSPEFVEFAAEKPSFSQKCSMLSHYFKETGNFGDLTLGIMTSAADAHPSYENVPTTTSLPVPPHSSPFFTVDKLLCSMISLLIRPRKLCFWLAGEAASPQLLLLILLLPKSILNLPFHR
ncbi:hypothetical protein LINPERHAP2_LOCUS9335, partial [Linum perenne]